VLPSLWFLFWFWPLVRHCCSCGENLTPLRFQWWSSSDDVLHTFQTLLRSKVARWFIFKPKIPFWVKFWGSCNGICWYILCSFNIFYCHLVYFYDHLVYFVVVSYKYFTPSCILYLPRKIWQTCYDLAKWMNSLVQCLFEANTSSYIYSFVTVTKRIIRRTDCLINFFWVSCLYLGHNTVIYVWYVVSEFSN
jgi:hypothetical protein